MEKENIIFSWDNFPKAKISMEGESGGNKNHLDVAMDDLGERVVMLDMPKSENG